MVAWKKKIDQKFPAEYVLTSQSESMSFKEVADVDGQSEVIAGVFHTF